MLQSRILNNTNMHDRESLQAILENYIRDGEVDVNPVYVNNNLQIFAKWIFQQFLKCKIDDFAIAGLFNDDELVHIMVGYKFDIGWGASVSFDTTPYWYVGLAYFKDKKWRHPGDDLIRLGWMLSNIFERQGFYKFYTTKKMSSRKLKTSEDLNKYINSPAFKETYKVERYTPKIEKIFYTTDDIVEIGTFETWRKLLPRGISRPIMLIEYTLDPTIDIKKIVEDYKKEKAKLNNNTVGVPKQWM